jgi:hypothetical protein
MTTRAAQGIALALVLLAVLTVSVVVPAEAQTFRADPRSVLLPGAPEAFLHGRPVGPSSVPRAIQGRTGPKLGSECVVAFSDFDALGWLPGFAQDTFAYSPYYSQLCNAVSQAVVRPVYINHYHLLYEDPHITLCDGTFQRVLDDGTCQPIDPRTEGRSLAPHYGNEIIHFYVWDSPGSQMLPFNFKRIRVGSGAPIRFCYKPVQEIEGPWVTYSTDGMTGPGVWYCWNQLDTGNWDVSDYTWFVTEIKITGTPGLNVAVFQIDDLVLTTP